MSTKQSRATARRHARQAAAFASFKRAFPGAAARGAFGQSIEVTLRMFENAPEVIKQRIVEGYKRGWR